SKPSFCNTDKFAGMKQLLLLIINVLIYSSGWSQYKTKAQQQIFTNEDSLNAGTAVNKTIISGYGSAAYQRNFDIQQSTATLERIVLFVGHQFNKKIAFFSEMEIENAKVEGGDNNGAEIAMEQAFIKFNLNAKQYIIAGLFIPRIGILNENHLPVNFNGVERPIVEQLIIPATWRELGVGFYGSANRLPLNYSVAVMNGLNSEGFQHGSGIREGRAEGSTAFANNIAVNAALQYSVNNLKFQVSGYAGGTVGLSKRSADSLGLDSGAFGTPVYIGEADVQYAHNGIAFKALGTYIRYPDAAKINSAYTKNIATGMYGAYAEVGYDWLHKKTETTQQFITFLRGEMLDLNASIPAPPKAVYDGTQKQTHIIAGVSYLPILNVVLKADVRILHTGEQNSDLIINPAPNALPYKQNNQFLNIGIGYSF
ncbi:MAG: hypothetical protein M3Z56_02230, partial [Bacteroidota bacterium]|nr:hypothetical protein [Bacteroidota bacterium]